MTIREIRGGSCRGVAHGTHGSHGIEGGADRTGLNAASYMGRELDSADYAFVPGVLFADLLRQNRRQSRVPMIDTTTRTSAIQRE